MDGGHFVDVRAQIGGRIFGGIHGYPRPDSPIGHHSGTRPALAGFNVPIDLPFGQVTLILEVLTIEGSWMAFETVCYEGTGATDEIDLPSTLRQFHWHDFTRGLELVLRSRRTHPTDSWTRIATMVAAELPINQDSLLPTLPFVGNMDEPATTDRCRFGLMPVVGYLFHQSEKITKLWISAELQTLQPLTLGRATPNLSTQFPDCPNAAACGYSGYVDIPPQLPNPVALRIYAETDQTPLRLVQVRTARRYDAEIEKYPCQGSQQEFDEAVSAWRSALRLRGIATLAEPDLPAAMEHLRLDFTRPGASTTHTVSARPRRPLQHVLLATHNLNLEGAPLFLLDLARGLAAAGLSLTVVSPAGGALHARFVALGAIVQIIDATPVFGARDAQAATAGIAALAHAVDFAGADLVIGNTFTTFWAVHAAKAAGTPVLYYVHESTSPAAFYRRDLHPAVLALAEDALMCADAVTFTSAATSRYHAWPGRPVKAVLTPGWVDLAWIDDWIARNPRDMLRARFNLQPGELLITNVGTVCDRKAQLSFVRAVALFNQRHPNLAGRVRFVLLGGRKAWFDHYLGEVLAGLALPNLVVHPETPDFLGYYVAADLTVCSSYEESSPRVVLEAMACGTPLLASDIPGISEMARNGIEAALVSPGHTTAWAEALAHVLNTPAEAASRARAARARIESHYAASIVLPRHLALARAVAAGESVS